MSRREGNSIMMTVPPSPAITSAARSIVERPFQSYMPAQHFQPISQTSHKRGDR